VRCDDDSSDECGYSFDDSADEEESTTQSKVLGGIVLLLVGLLNALWKFIKAKVSQICCKRKTSIDDQAQKMAENIEMKNGIIPKVAATRDVDVKVAPIQEKA